MKNFLQKSCLTAIVLCFSVVGFAHDFEVDGIYYNKNSDGVSVSVTYRGEYYYAFDNDYFGDVAIPSQITYNGLTYPVTSICDYSFYDCDGLNSVNIGNSVTLIGNWAFSGCNKLTSVTIPNSVTSIGKSAFSDCSGLTSVTIPNSVFYIGIEAFYNCSGLASVTVGHSVTTIRESAFSFCGNLSTIMVEDGNPFFDSRDNCNAIIETKSNTLIVGGNNTEIPNSVTNIGEYAFRGCSGLYSVNIPNSVTSISVGSFACCRNLTSVTLPNSIISIGMRAFSGCFGLNSVIIPDSVTSIDDDAFRDCSGLTSIQCAALTPPSLGNNVFYNVDKMACTLIVPEESLGAYQVADQWKDFLNVSGVEEIAIEDSNISVENGMIINRNNVIIEVYNLSGAKVYTGYDAEVSLNGGMYIVKVGDKVVKIAI